MVVVVVAGVVLRVVVLRVVVVLRCVPSSHLEVQGSVQFYGEPTTVLIGKLAGTESEKGE